MNDRNDHRKAHVMYALWVIVFFMLGLAVMGGCNLQPGEPHTNRAEIVSVEAYICETDHFEPACFDGTPDTLVLGEPIGLQVTVHPVPEADNRVYLWMYIGDAPVNYGAVRIPVGEGTWDVRFGLAADTFPFEHRADIDVRLVEGAKPDPETGEWRGGKVVEVAADTSIAWGG